MLAAHCDHGPIRLSWALAFPGPTHTYWKDLVDAGKKRRKKSPRSSAQSQRQKREQKAREKEIVSGAIRLLKKSGRISRKMVGEAVNMDRKTVSKHWSSVEKEAKKKFGRRVKVENHKIYLTRR